MLWKPFREEARPPRWFPSVAKQPERAPGKVIVTAFRCPLDRRARRAHICIMTQTSKRPPRQRCCEPLGSVLSPRLFKALCDPNRVAILARLAESCGPSTVSQVAECCPVNLSVVSRHLAQLRDAGILHAEKRGKEVHYSIRAEELVSTLRAIADAIERCCAGADQAAKKRGAP